MLLWQALTAAVFFTIGASFAEAASHRILQAWYLPGRKKISGKWAYLLLGRSRCEQCSHTLSAADLIPIFGYLLRRGRCRYCGTGISSRHLKGEIAAFLYGGLLGAFHPPDLTLPVFWIAFIALWIVMRIDRRMMLIPTEALFVLLACGILISAIGDYGWLSDRRGMDFAELNPRFIAAFIWFFLLYLIRILSRYQLGLADVRLVFALALITGFPASLHITTLASVLGLIWYFAGRRRREGALADRGWKTRLPFGVFLGVAALILKLVQVLQILAEKKLLGF